MAFNWQTFRTRALTAVVFVLVMGAGLLWNQWSFLVLFSIIHFGCWWEYFKLLEKIYNTSYAIYLKLGLMLIGYGLMLWFCGPLFQIAGYGLKENFSLPVSAAGFALTIMGVFQKGTINLKPFAAAALGLVYISLSWGLMMQSYNGFSVSSFDGTSLVEYQLEPGWLPVFIIVSIWINDTMAYIVGSLIGKTPLSKISPKKTWEGTIGGILLSIIVVGAIAYFAYPVINKTGTTFLILIGAMAGIAAISGTFGDLLESKLKRRAGVKDSGNIMPGHGGFLDRFDSLLIAVPCVWLYFELIMPLFF